MSRRYRVKAPVNMMIEVVVEADCAATAKLIVEDTVGYWIQNKKFGSRLVLTRTVMTESANLIDDPGNAQLEWKVVGEAETDA